MDNSGQTWLPLSPRPYRRMFQTLPILYFKPAAGVLLAGGLGHDDHEESECNKGSGFGSEFPLKSSEVGMMLAERTQRQDENVECSWI